MSDKEQMIVERAKRLKRKNSLEALTSAALDLGFEVAGDDTKDVVARALAEHEIEQEALDENLTEPPEPADSIEGATTAEIDTEPPPSSEPPPPPPRKPYKAPTQVKGSYVPTTAITYCPAGGDSKTEQPTKQITRKGVVQHVPNVLRDIGPEDLAHFLKLGAVEAHFE